MLMLMFLLSTSLGLSLACIESEDPLRQYICILSPDARYTNTRVLLQKENIETLSKIPITLNFTVGCSCGTYPISSRLWETTLSDVLSNYAALDSNITKTTTARAYNDAVTNSIVVFSFVMMFAYAFFLLGLNAGGLLWK